MKTSEMMAEIELALRIPGVGETWPQLLDRIRDHANKSSLVEQRAEELAQQKVEAANASLVTSQATIDRYKAEQSALQTQVQALTEQVCMLKEHISEYRSWRELLHRVVRNEGGY